MNEPRRSTRIRAKRDEPASTDLPSSAGPSKRRRIRRNAVAEENTSALHKTRKLKKGTGALTGALQHLPLDILYEVRSGPSYIRPRARLRRQEGLWLLSASRTASALSLYERTPRCLTQPLRACGMAKRAPCTTYTRGIRSRIWRVAARMPSKRTRTRLRLSHA
jgi:hypothetical protein